MRLKTCMMLFSVSCMFASLADASETLMTFTRLSGGHNGEYTMITTDGSVWESNCPVYTPSHNYYMEYVFDGLHPKAGYDTEWCGASSGIATPWFSVTFPTEVYITKIRTYPIAGGTGHWASSYVMTSTDGTTYVTQGTIDSEPHIYDADYEEFYVDVIVNDFVKSIKYEFYDMAEAYYTVLPEAEFYTDDSPVAVPEPATLVLVCSAVAALLKRTRRS